MKKDHIRYQNCEQSRQELGTFLDNKVDTLKIIAVKILKRNKLLSDIIKITICILKVNECWCGEIQRLQCHALYSIQW